MALSESMRKDDHERMSGPRTSRTMCTQQSTCLTSGKTFFTPLRIGCDRSEDAHVITGEIPKSVCTESRMQRRTFETDSWDDPQEARSSQDLRSLHAMTGCHALGPGTWRDHASGSRVNGFEVHARTSDSEGTMPNATGRSEVTHLLAAFSLTSGVPTTKSTQFPT